MHASAPHFVGRIGIRQGIARGRLVEIVIGGRNDRLEVDWLLAMEALQTVQSVSSNGCGNPGHAVLEHDGLVVGNLLCATSGGKIFRSRMPVPNEIVFLAPGIGLVEGQDIVIAIRGHLHPVLGIGPGHFLIFLGRGLVRRASGKGRRKRPVLKWP